MNERRKSYLRDPAAECSCSRHDPWREIRLNLIREIERSDIRVETEGRGIERLNRAFTGKPRDTSWNLMDDRYARTIRELSDLVRFGSSGLSKRRLF